MKVFRSAFGISLFAGILGCGADATPQAPDSAAIDSPPQIDTAPSVDRPNIDSPAIDAPASEDGSSTDGSVDAGSCVCITPGACEIGPGTCNSNGQCVYTKRSAGFVCRA